MAENVITSAEKVQEAMVEKAINKASSAAIPSTDLEPHQFKELDCVDCGDPLPLFRCQKGRIRCVRCENAKERRARGL